MDNMECVIYTLKRDIDYRFCHKIYEDMYNILCGNLMPDSEEGEDIEAIIDIIKQISKERKFDFYYTEILIELLLKHRFIVDYYVGYKLSDRIIKKDDGHLYLKVDS